MHISTGEGGFAASPYALPCVPIPLKEMVDEITAGEEPRRIEITTGMPGGYDAVVEEKLIGIGLDEVYLLIRLGSGRPVEPINIWENNLSSAMRFPNGDFYFKIGNISCTVCSL